MIQYKAARRCEKAPVVRLFLARFLVCVTLPLLIAASVQGQATLDWSTVVWNDGDLTNTYTLSNGVMAMITVAQTVPAGGSFTSPSPNEDGPGAATNFAGSGLDLGIQFAGTSPVTITVTFTPAATDIAFEVSDIDSSLSRTDTVVVACDGGVPDSFVAKTMTPTFMITGGDTATGTSAGSADDNGSVQVDCGAGAVSTVLITYTGSDANNRGIGALFMLTEVPVELMSFAVE